MSTTFTFFLNTKATDSKTVSRLLREYLPYCERGSILVTTRNKEAALKLVKQCDIISIELIEKAEGIALFTKKLGPQANNSDVTKLAAVLKYMPLAIMQATAYILQRGL
jgi:hypothetical protein